MSTTTPTLTPGMTVEVTQQIAQRDETWSTTIRGTVVRFTQAETGSWFAHARHHRLWLDRLLLETEDGERVELILDNTSHVRVIAEA